MFIFIFHVKNIGPFSFERFIVCKRFATNTFAPRDFSSQTSKNASTSLKNNDLSNAKNNWFKPLDHANCYSCQP